MTVYMCVTTDKYELPVAVADTVVGLAKTLKIHPGTIFKCMYQAKHFGAKSKYIKVNIEED